MKSILRYLNWQRCLVLSLAVLLALIVLNFYGLYTSKFYFFKADNYIFPILSLVHFTFLYVMRFKIKEEEYADPQMRNIEYTMYGILVVYVFKVLETIEILLTYTDYQDHIVPGSFLPIGITIALLQLFLIVLTFVTFGHRKEKVGEYNFDNINGNIDSWQ